VNVVVRFVKPLDDDVYEAYWLELGKAVRSYATHGIDAEFETEWWLNVETDELAPLREDLNELAKRHGQYPASVVAAERSS
jgi:hypothetical protein